LQSIHNRIQSGTPYREDVTQNRSPELVITVNGRALRVSAGMTVAAALLAAGETSRISVSGEQRAPLCGMGICMECCATVNGVAHVRTCQVVAEPGMEIVR
jgi:D-hydroxyproline dehydrogenase subunit gamma